MDYILQQNLITSSTLSKEQITARGWTDELLQLFYPKLNFKNHINLNNFLKKENYLSFQKFTNLNDFNLRKKETEKIFEKHTNHAISTIKSLNIELNKKSINLNLLKFNTQETLISFNNEITENFYDPNNLTQYKLNPNHSYLLFTDGSHKDFGGHSFSSCAGFIYNKTTKQIVVQFYKKIKNQHPQMPQFELIGIQEGLKIVQQLKLKNVTCYTDSLTDSKTICYALNNIGGKRLYDLAEYYNPIINIIKETQSSISWIPRDYNKQADTLNKCLFNYCSNNNKMQ